MPRKTQTQASFFKSFVDISDDSDEEQREPAANIPLLTTNLVKYLVHQSSRKTPFEKSELKHLNIPPKVLAKVLQNARDLLKEIYGLEVREISDKSTKKFIIYSALNCATKRQHNVFVQKDSFLLFIILSYIFMKGKAQEVHLLQFLRLCLRIDDENNSAYGDVSKLVKETFVKQHYLTRTKVEIEGKDEPQIHLSWGARAKAEYDPKKVLTVVSKIMQKNPVSFVRQYAEAYGESTAMDCDN